MEVRRAFFVGIDDYADQRIPALHGAENDAKEMCDLLASDGSFTAIDKPLLGRAATGAAIRTGLSDLLWRTDPTDLALFYFSGHAFDDEYGNGFLAPYDMEYERPLVHGIRMQELNALAAKAVNKDVVLLILDACKSGIAATGERGSSPAQNAYDDVFDLGEGKGRFVLASSGADEKSRERDDCEHQYLDGPPHTHGAFTYELIEGLSGCAASDGANVTLLGLHAFVERGMRRQTVTFYSSGMQHAEQIHLSTATRFATISEQLDEAEKHLANGNVESPFRAIRALTPIQVQTRNNVRAIKLTKEIDKRLRDDAQQAMLYVNDRRWDLLDCPNTCRAVQSLLADVSCDTLIGVEQGMLGLLVGLWEAMSDEPSFEAWRATMVSYEKRRSEPDQVKSSNPTPRTPQSS